MTIKPIAIAEIEVLPCGRDLRIDGIVDLMQSMERLGLLNPIGVRLIEEKPRLVYGRHRLVAAGQLGWAAIDSHIIEADDRRARMAEIAENLHRSELTAQDRADQIAAWIKLCDEEVSAQVAQKTGPGRPEGGLSAAARELGIDRDAARRAQTIASLSAEAKTVAKELALDDNQSALLAAAKSDDPAAALRAHAQREHRAPKERATAERKTAVITVATLLVEYLGDRLPELIASLRLIDQGKFLLNSGLDVALHERRPDVCDWLDGDDDVLVVSNRNTESIEPTEPVTNIVSAETDPSGLQPAA